MNRRSAVIGLGAVMLAGRSDDQAYGQAAPGMDFDDPADNLDALVRIYGANDGTTYYWYARGRIYAVMPGRVAEPLFDGAAVQWIRFKPQDDGTFRQESQFVQLHYQDGAVVDTAVNPITRNTYSVPVMQSGNQAIRQSGNQAMP